jgi:hypothetical protein
MNHACIVGPTRCGKSHLAKAIGGQLKDKGRLVFVLDPLGDAWPAHKTCREPAEFLELAKANREALLIIDESSASIGRGNDAKDMLWLPQRSRHWGHQCFFIMHRHSSVEPQVREMCDTLFLFGVYHDEAKYWAASFNDSALLDAPNLEQYHFYKKTLYRPIEEMKT